MEKPRHNPSEKRSLAAHSLSLIGKQYHRILTLIFLFRMRNTCSKFTANTITSRKDPALCYTILQTVVRQSARQNMSLGRPPKHPYLIEIFNDPSATINNRLFDNATALVLIGLSLHDQVA